LDGIFGIDDALHINLEIPGLLDFCAYCNAMLGQPFGTSKRPQLGTSVRTSDRLGRFGIGRTSLGASTDQHTQRS